MKNFKRFTAAIAATLMAASLSVPMAMNVSAASIEITGLSTEQAHKFEVYQVLTGTQSGGKLVDMKWGSGVSQFNNATVTPGTALTEAQLTSINEVTDARTLIAGNSPLLKLSETKACEDVTSSSEKVTISGLADGYYIVKDVTNLSNVDDANSAWIIQVAGSATVPIKKAKPTVDKQIQDEVDDAELGSTDGWGETADHAINESFKFKLTATIPKDDNLAAYDSYKITFNDSMSKGVTFEEIESVKITSTNDDDIEVDEKSGEAHGYTKSVISTDTETGEQTWTLEIDDVKALAGERFGAKEIIVEVIYKAHLNEDAIVYNANSQAVKNNLSNNNTVSLSYSNNPDSTGIGGNEGKTTPDTVWAFTYEVDNTKYANSIAEINKLAGATFRLYSDSGCQKEVLLTYNADKAAYVPVAANVTEGVAMESSATGVFNIKGLDVGTYYLKEISAPTGYNLLTEAKEIKISAGHLEVTDTLATMTLDEDSNMTNNIVNKSGSTLPSTGGMGTKLFFLGGGSMVAVAGIFLITKKRMGKNAE